MFPFSHYAKVVNNTSGLTCAKSGFTNFVLNTTSKSYKALSQ